MLWRRWRRDEDREDVISTDDPPVPGIVVFNFLQQSLPEPTEAPASPVEQGETGTTDPWGVTDS